MAELADAALLAVVAIGSVKGSAALVTARWPRRSPVAAILLWQALGLSGGLAAVGALVVLGVAPQYPNVASGLTRVTSAVAAGHSIAPGQPGILAIARLLCLAAGLSLFILLCWVLAAAGTTVLTARRRQRELLALLAHGDPKAPGALVVDHPTAAAYCLPGLRSKIVISVGTLDLLGPAELGAVLAHERAHLRERHDLVLLPFSALLRAFKQSGTCERAYSSVALLVEMHADDRALRARPARALASALVRFGTAGTGYAPAGTLAAHEGEMTARVSRLLEPPTPLRPPAVAAVCCASALLVILPVALVLIPT